MADFVCRKAQLAVDAGGKGLTDEDRRVYFSALEVIASNLDSISREGLPPDETPKEQL